MQAVKFMDKILSHGVRSYAIGFIIRNTAVTLWYGGRIGLVQAKAFDFKEESHMLFLDIAAIAFSDHARMSTCPFLIFPSSSYDSYVGAKIVLNKGLAVDASRHLLQQVVFDIDNTRRVKAEYGHGTTIVPIKATGSAETSGRGNLVAKLAWPSVHREAEDNFIRIVRCKLKENAPQYLNHIIDLKCSVTRSMDQMQLPRVLMHGISVYDHRVFRMMIIESTSRSNLSTTSRSAKRYSSTLCVVSIRYHFVTLPLKAHF